MALGSFLAFIYLNCSMITSGKICAELLNLKYFAAAVALVTVPKVAD